MKSEDVVRINGVFVDKSKTIVNEFNKFTKRNPDDVMWWDGSIESPVSKVVNSIASVFNKELASKNKVDLEDNDILDRMEGFKTLDEVCSDNGIEVIRGDKMIGFTSKK